MKMLLATLVAFLFALTLAAQEPVRAGGEAITVERVILDAHITDSKGNPLLGLKRGDVEVRIDNLPSEVESIEWVDASTPSRATPDSHPLHVDELLDNPPGRVIVIFFQTDFARVRAGGQMKMIPFAKKFLATMTPSDRVAVASFDSHLKIRQDFTSDREAIERAIDEAINIDSPVARPGDGSMSILDHLDLDDARDAATPERGFLLLGEALRKIPGAKTMVLFGWGLGHYRSGAVVMDKDYGSAKQALEDARVSVFSLDISDADYHSLEVGLGKVAGDTGGFYAKTNVFPQFAMDKLTKTIRGHYEIVVKKASNYRGVHAVQVSLRKGLRGEVYSRGTYIDQE